MSRLLFNERIYWGNSIEIKIGHDTYYGNGTCYIWNEGYKYKYPTINQLKKNVKVSGHCSNPFIKNGDILVYKTDSGDEILLRFSCVCYYKDPGDMFYGNLKYLDPHRKTIFDRIKSFF